MEDNETMVTLIDDEGINELKKCNINDCFDCADLEHCYYEACEKSNHEFAESCDYGGFNTEEEFWENLMD